MQTENATILCDPIFDNTISGGGNMMYPHRIIDVPRLPMLDAVFLSHHHSDHFSIRDLSQISQIEEIPIYAPRYSTVIKELTAIGLTNVHELQVGNTVVVSDLEVHPTPSAVDFPEIGFFYKCGEDSFLNLVDSQIVGQTETLKQIVGPKIPLVLAPFQAGGYMSLLPLRVGGPPDGLVEAIKRWSVEDTDLLVKELQQFDIGHIVPFADGLTYVDIEINSWHFPQPDEYFLDLMLEQGVSGSICTPGTVYTMSSSGVNRSQSSDFVSLQTGVLVNKSFNPDTQIHDMPMSCRSWRNEVQSDIRTAGEICEYSVWHWDNYLRGKINLTNNMAVDRHLDWYLEMCDDPQQMHYLWYEYESRDLRIQSGTTKPMNRNFGVRLHGNDLKDLLDDRILLEHITLGGAFRYHSPKSVELEQVRKHIFDPLHTLISNKDENS